jgi:tricorn protease
MAFDFDKREASRVLEKVDAFEVSADGGTLLLRSGSEWSLADEKGKDRKTLPVASVKVRVDPAQEWPQILRECWRIQRDWFYDARMHGVDWEAMWARWSAFLPHVHDRADLNLLMGEMMGELCCGHEYVSGGDVEEADAGPGVGLLGADLEAAEGHWRIARIYAGQNWNPGLRSPLTEPGVKVAAGDWLLAVDGRRLTADQNVYAAFEGTAGQPVDLEVSSKPDRSEPRTVRVVPIGDEGRLRRQAWIEENRLLVERLSGGRLAYVYLPNTAGAGLAAFNRDFYSQLDKQGIVIDERFNGGGKVADALVDVLARRVLCYWGTREGWLGRTPFGTMEGPKVMVINERAGSGGDALPWMFKRLGLGTLVGTRTWGGLVGISGYPPLLDGGSCTAASFGIVDTDGRWIVENEGVTPDVEVIEWPKEVLAGRDPQLERAVAIALEQLERSPAAEPPSLKPPPAR